MYVITTGAPMRMNAVSVTLMPATRKITLRDDRAFVAQKREALGVSFATVRTTPTPLRSMRRRAGCAPR